MSCHRAVPGLDTILPELEFPRAKGNTIAIRGLPGVGKTLLAMQLAYRHFCQREGYCVKYLDLEQPEEVSRRPISAFGWGDAPPQRWDLDCCRLSLSALDARLAKWTPPSNTPGLVVIDSLSAVEPDATRQDLDTLRNRLTEWRNSLLLVLEEQHASDERYRWVDYLADVVIAMGVEIRAGYATRTLEVVKCRGRRVERGRHPFSVVLREQAPDFGEQAGGLVVHPGLSCRLAMAAREIACLSRTRPDGHPATWSFGLTGINEMIGRGGQVGLDESVLLLGHDGCMKSPVALHALVPPLVDEKSVLIISFGISKQRLLEDARVHPELSALVRDGGFSPGVHWFSCSPGHEGPERLLSRLDSVLASAKEAGKPITRAVVADVGNIPHGFPCCDAQPMFVVALHQLLRSHRIGAFFVETRHGEGVPFSSRLVDWVSIVLELQRLSVYGHDRIGVRVRRREGPDVLADFRELRVTEAEGKRFLSAESSLDGFVNLQSGEPRPAPISVYLHSETFPQRRFNESLDKMLRLAVPGRSDSSALTITHFSHASAGAVYRGLLFPDVSPQPDACIATLDEWWAWHLKEAGRLLELNPSASETELLWDGMGGSGFSHCLPHILNVGVSVVASQARSLHDALWARQLRWDDVLVSSVERALGELAKVDPRDGRRWRAFGFDTTSRQSWACLVAEVLMAMPAESGGGRRSLAELLGAPGAAEALLRLRELFWLGADRDERHQRMCELRRAFSGQTAQDVERQLDSGGSFLVGDASQSKYVLRRLWYNTVLGEVYVGRLQPGEFVLAPVVGGTCISGHWYVAALKRSTAPETARAIVKEMTAREDLAFARHVEGVGLSALEGLYGPDRCIPACDQATSLSRLAEGVIRGHSVSRLQLLGPSEYQHYALTALVLSQLLYSVLSLEGERRSVLQAIASQVRTAASMVSANATPAQ